MNKIKFLVVALLFFNAISFAQTYPINQTIGAPSTLVTSKGGFKADSSLIVPYFLDTTKANISSYIKNYPGNLIRVGDSLYVRSSTANKWNLVNASGGGSTDTTSLSNRINQAFTSATKISDTSFFMSSPTGTNDTIILNGAPVYVESPIMAKVSNDSNIIYFNPDTANAWRGGSGVTPDLQQVTTAGRVTVDSITVQDITFKNPSLGVGPYNSIFLGYGSTYNGLTSAGTIAIGDQVMDGSTPSGQSVVIGATAGQYGYPNDCVLIGEQAGGFMSNIGSPNGNLDAVGIGHQSLYGASGVQDGVFVGAYSGKSSTGEQAISIGHSAGESNSKDTTILIGYSSGKLNSGNRLISIGGNSGISNTFNDGIILGANTGLTADSQLVVANYVNKLKLPGLGKGTANYVLTDTTGNGDLVLKEAPSGAANDTAKVVIAKVRNVTATTLQRGEVVYLFGASGDVASVKRANNKSDSTSSKTFGIVRRDILAGDTGYITTQGQIEKLNLGSYTEGDILWLDSLDGQFTKVKPQAPYHAVFLGVVERANAGNGIAYVKPQNGVELDEVHDVQINNLQNNQILVYSDTQQVWKNRSAYTVIDTTKLQQKSLPAYSIMGNGTNVAANPTAVYYKDTSGTYTGSPTWNGTAPTSGSLTYRWTRIGKMVTLNISLVYSVAGSSNSVLTVPLPADCPTPIEPTGLTANSLFMYNAQVKIFANFNALAALAERAGLRKNIGGTGYEVNCSAGTGTTAVGALITVTYWTN